MKRNGPASARSFSANPAAKRPRKVTVGQPSIREKLKKASEVEAKAVAKMVDQPYFLGTPASKRRIKQAASVRVAVIGATKKSK